MAVPTLMPDMMKRGAAAVLALFVAGCTTGAPWDGQDDVAEGHRLFFDKACHGCHSVGLVGTSVGPDLAHVGEIWTRADLETWLTDPSAHDAVAQMPKIVLTPEEISALATYLLSLDPSEGDPTPSDLTRP